MSIEQKECPHILRNNLDTTANCILMKIKKNGAEVCQACAQPGLPDYWPTA